MTFVPLFAAAFNTWLAVWVWGLGRYGWAGAHAGLALFMLGCFVIALREEKK